MSQVIMKLNGQVALLVDIEEGGFGVIIGQDHKEYIFKLDTLAGFDGMDVAATGLCEGAQVELEVDGEKVLRVKVLRKPK